MAVMDYRTRDGLADYGFSIEYQSDSGWRIYIIFDPLPRGDNDTQNLPYQSIDDNKRRYVNWGAKLDSLGDARTVAALWAELVQHYQRTQGQRMVTPTSPGRLGDATEAEGAKPEHRHDGSVISHPTMAAESSRDFPEGKLSSRATGEVA